MLADTHAGTNYMHESFNPEEPEEFTRPWFAWANSLLGELLGTLMEQGFFDGEEKISRADNCLFDTWKTSVFQVFPVFLCTLSGAVCYKLTKNILFLQNGLDK